MSYQVLARKYRPRAFTEMVGQEHVLRALINGLDNDRLHHAFLFSGTRGVGKTTVARVLARCLNCETGVGSTPCGECGACREIDEGRFVDLIEVDAASRTRVEDTRELLDNVQYAPSRGRYKIYLIDEVHMLSSHSFNALLKTLEEPPPHVKFLLATTDPQKVPVTILSRCLQFNLKRLPASLIGEHVMRVLEWEGISGDSRGVQRLARAADGSMRDALSLTDQAIAYGGGSVNDDDVRSMLGSMEDDAVLQVLECIADRDAEAILQVVAGLAERAADFSDVLSGVLTTLHTLVLAQTVAGTVEEDHPERERILALASRLSPEDLQLFYQIGLHGRRDLPLAPEPRAGFEMVMLRMLCFRPDPDENTRAVDASRFRPSQSPPAARVPEARRAAGPPAARKSAEREAPEARAGATPSGSEPARAETAPVAAGAAGLGMGQDQPSGVIPSGDRDSVPPWPELLEQLDLRGISRALAMHCSWGGFTGDRLVLRLERSHAHLRNRSVEQRMEQAFSRVLGRKLSLAIEVVGEAIADTPAELADQSRARQQEEAEQSIARDPTVRALQDLFDAEVVPDSIQPRQ